MKDHQPYPDLPERFDDREQILCRESLTGRCYWEVKWEGSCNVAITYKKSVGKVELTVGLDSMKSPGVCIVLV